MNGWHKKHLGELVDILSGFAFKSERFGDAGDLPLIRIRDVVPGHSSTFYRGEYDPKYLIEDGEILIGMDGEFNCARWYGGKALLNQRVCSISPINGNLSGNYLFHFLPTALKTIEDAAPYVTVKHLSVKDIRNIEIMLPSLSEQRRIAAILDKAEELRAKRRAALGQLDTLTESIFLELFGEPGNKRNRWPKVDIQTITEVITGYPFRSEEYVEEGDSVKLCRGANVLPDRLDWSDLACWPKSKVEYLSEFAIAAGDIVLAMDRPWISDGFKIAQVEKEDCPALLVQRVARLRGKGGVPNEFIYALLRQPAFTQHCRPTETTVPHISPAEIKSFKFHLPPPELQSNFAHRVVAVNKLKAAYRASLATMDALFATLQHRAFRGEL